MYPNIASYLYRKQIKSKMGNKLYLRMIFICVRLNWLDIHDCHTMTLKKLFTSKTKLKSFIESLCLKYVVDISYVPKHTGQNFVTMIL